MALAGHELALGLAILLGKFGPLPVNPPQARNDGQAHGVIIEPQRCGHPHPTTRRIDAYVEILDAPCGQPLPGSLGCRCGGL